MPRGFVNIKRSFGCAPEFLTNEDSLTSPVTTSPYLGSLSSIECPPRIEIPASSALSDPPFKIRAATSLGISPTGNAKIFNAKVGFAPIAYISDNELAAAI